MTEAAKRMLKDDLIFAESARLILRARWRRSIGGCPKTTGNHWEGTCLKKLLLTISADAYTQARLNVSLSRLLDLTHTTGGEYEQHKVSGMRSGEF
jgi:hypothetical protein